MKERQKLCKILYFHIKYLEKFYKDMKMKGIEYDFYIENLSKDLKITQKILEYIRKGYDYSFKNDDEDFEMNFYISVVGRDTWRKIDKRFFEISFSESQFKLYEDKLMRQMKLMRILKNAQ